MYHNGAARRIGYGVRYRGRCHTDCREGYARAAQDDICELKWGSGMIYAMSDIHGFTDLFQRNLKRIDLSGENRLVLLGDYIDHGPESGKTLRLVIETQKRYGVEKVIAIRGNHEEAFLDWLDAWSGPNAGKPDENGIVPWSGWLCTDPDYGALRAFVTEKQWESFQQIVQTASEDALNIEAARMVLSSNGDLIPWLRGLPYFYETERQIFVHAGIDEASGDRWRYSTPKSVFLDKHPASAGSFYKDIIGGHLSTAHIAGDPDFHGVYHDGQSHYYIDGTVYESGRIPILVYDETDGKYWEMGPEPHFDRQEE